jgi:hypothetical protein
MSVGKCVDQDEGMKGGLNSRARKVSPLKPCLMKRSSSAPDGKILEASDWAASTEAYDLRCDSNLSGGASRQASAPAHIQRRRFEFRRSPTNLVVAGFRRNSEFYRCRNKIVVST